MSTAPRHLEFAPPPTPGLVRALVLAILAHAVLLFVLSLGVQWKRDAVPQTFEAELWSALPVEAAPPAPEPTPEPPPVPEPPKPVPPEPKVQPKTVPPPPDTAKVKADADIALAKENEKARLLKEKKLALEQAELEKKKRAKLEQAKKDLLDKQKKEQADKLAREQDAQQRKLDAKDAANLAKARAEQLKRMEKLAGGSGGSGAASSTGSAAQSSAPSASYVGRLRAAVYPNIVFSGDTTGNPQVEVEVRTLPSGTIVNMRVTRSSGVKSWDEAVIRALEKTAVLPKDVDGSIPPVIPFLFRPQKN
jgi:colicin import membrane protein